MKCGDRCFKCMRSVTRLQSTTFGSAYLSAMPAFAANQHFALSLGGCDQVMSFFQRLSPRNQSHRTTGTPRNSAHRPHLQARPLHHSQAGHRPAHMLLYHPLARSCPACRLSTPAATCKRTRPKASPTRIPLFECPRLH